MNRRRWLPKKVKTKDFDDLLADWQSRVFFILFSLLYFFSTSNNSRIIIRQWNSLMTIFRDFGVITQTGALRGGFRAKRIRRRDSKSFSRRLIVSPCATVIFVDFDFLSSISTQHSTSLIPIGKVSIRFFRPLIQNIKLFYQ